MTPPPPTPQHAVELFVQRISANSYQFSEHDKATILMALGFAHSAYLLGYQPHRKYTGEHYIEHPIEVATLLLPQQAERETVCVALMHDVLEDTPITAEQMASMFSPAITSAVIALTDPTYPPASAGGPNRAARKNLDRERLAEAPGWVQTIKVADLISNTKSIVEHDPKFARVYLDEKSLLLDVLTEADSMLLYTARLQINGARKQLEGDS